MYYPLLINNNIFILYIYIHIIMNKSSSSLTSHSQKSELPSPNQKYISIEDFKAEPTSKIKINSPRSLLAMCQTGITQDELTFLSFVDFLNKYKDIRKMPTEIQTTRYEFCENQRKERINQIIKCRDAIINKDNLSSTTRNANNNHSSTNNNNINNNNNNNNNSNTLTHCNSTGNIYTKHNITSCYNNISTSLSNDLKQLEHIKEKNKMELLNMLQNQVNTQLLLQANERKLQKQKEKQETQQREMQLRAEEDRRKKERIQKERERRSLEEESKQQQRIKERKRLEEERIRKELADEQVREVETQRKRKEEEKKRKNFQMKLEQLQEEYRLQMKTRQIEMNKREKDRKLLLEHQRNEKRNEHEQLYKHKKALIEKNQKNLELKLQQLKQGYIDKEKKNDLKRKQFEEQRLFNYQLQQEQSLKKSLEIKKIIEKQEENEKMKLEKYHLKQKQISEKKILLQKLNQEEHEEKQRRIEAKNKQLQMKLSLNEENNILKQNQILKKIKIKQDNLQKAMKQREKELMFKSEEKVKRTMIIDENLLHISRKEQFERERTIEQINKRAKRLDDMKYQKLLIIEEKKRVQSEIAKKKEEFTNMFNMFFTKRNIDIHSLHSLKGMFSNNPKFTELCEQLKNSDRTLRTNNSFVGYNSYHNKTSLNNTFLSHKSDNKNKRSKSMIDDGNKEEGDGIGNNKNDNSSNEDIDKLVNDYRLQLNKELMSLIENEQQKEKDREVEYNRAVSAKEKTELDKKHSEERQIASQNITEFSK